MVGITLIKLFLEFNVLRLLSLRLTFQLSLFSSSMFKYPRLWFFMEHRWWDNLTIYIYIYIYRLAFSLPTLVRYTLAWGMSWKKGANFDYCKYIEEFSVSGLYLQAVPVSSSKKARVRFIAWWPTKKCNITEPNSRCYVIHQIYGRTITCSKLLMRVSLCLKLLSDLVVRWRKHKTLS